MVAKEIMKMSSSIESELHLLRITSIEKRRKRSTRITLFMYPLGNITKKLIPLPLPNENWEQQKEYIREQLSEKKMGEI